MTPSVCHPNPCLVQPIGPSEAQGPVLLAAGSGGCRKPPLIPPILASHCRDPRTPHWPPVLRSWLVALCMTRCLCFSRCVQLWGGGGDKGGVGLLVGTCGTWVFHGGVWRFVASMLFPLSPTQHALSLGRLKMRSPKEDMQGSPWWGLWRRLLCCGDTRLSCWGWPLPNGLAWCGLVEGCCL